MSAMAKSARYKWTKVEVKMMMRGGKIEKKGWVSEKVPWFLFIFFRSLFSNGCSLRCDLRFDKLRRPYHWCCHCTPCHTCHLAQKRNDAQSQHDCRSGSSSQPQSHHNGHSLGQRRASSVWKEKKNKIKSEMEKWNKMKKRNVRKMKEKKKRKIHNEEEMMPLIKTCARDKEREREVSITQQKNKIKRVEVKAKQREWDCSIERERDWAIDAW